MCSQIMQTSHPLTEHLTTTFATHLPSPALTGSLNGWQETAGLETLSVLLVSISGAITHTK